MELDSGAADPARILFLMPPDAPQGPQSGAGTSDLVFVRQLRGVVDRYLRAIEHWEAVYRKFYRMPGTAHRPASDLDDARRQFLAAYEEFQAAAPRARNLCRRFGVHDPWPGLLRVHLGLDSPQLRTTSAVGRNERNTISECLVALEHACAEPASAERTVEENPSLIRRVIDFFL